MVSSGIEEGFYLFPILGYYVLCYEIQRNNCENRVLGWLIVGGYLLMLAQVAFSIYLFIEWKSLVDQAYASYPSVYKTLLYFFLVMYCMFSLLIAMFSWLSYCRGEVGIFESVQKKKFIQVVPEAVTIESELKSEDENEIINSEGYLKFGINSNLSSFKITKKDRKMKIVPLRSYVQLISDIILRNNCITFKIMSSKDIEGNGVVGFTDYIDPIKQGGYENIYDCIGISGNSFKNDNSCNTDKLNKPDLKCEWMDSASWTAGEEGEWTFDAINGSISYVNIDTLTSSYINIDKQCFLKYDLRIALYLVAGVDYTIYDVSIK